MPRLMNLEPLEPRDVPATFNIPWIDGDQISVSFAPDSTSVDGVNSSLKSFMNTSGLSDAVWQGEILRAMQAWTNAANINFGIVADNGSPIGTVGSLQSDSRFGDIRIFAVPLSSNVAAITTPPDPMAGTRAGDIILNSNKKFTVGGSANTYDLYSVLLQEVGHALGIANNTDPASPMYEIYTGARTTLAATDIAAVQALYGVRAFNFYEFLGNNSANMATPIFDATLLGSRITVTLIGDLEANSDDWYKFTVPTTVSNLTIQLQTGGYSLAQGALSVLTSTQSVVASSAASGAGKDVSLSVGLTPGATYYIRVADAVGTAFTSGLYRLRLIPPGASDENVSFAGSTNFVENNLNNTYDRATPLVDQDPSDWKSYSFIATLAAADVDHFSVTAPLATTQEKVILTASVRAYQGVVAPDVVVLDAAGVVQPVVVAADGNGFYAVEFSDATPGAKYIIKVQDRTGVLTGIDYKLDVSFRNQTRDMATIVAGSTSNTSVKTSLKVNRSVMMAFDLGAAFSSGSGSITMTIVNSSQQTVFSLVVNAGDTVTGIALLNAGVYTVNFKVNRSGSSSSIASISLLGSVLSDPVGVTSSKSTTSSTISADDWSSSTTDKSWTTKTASGSSTMTM